MSDLFVWTLWASGEWLCYVSTRVSVGWAVVLVPSDTRTKDVRCLSCSFILCFTSALKLNRSFHSCFSYHMPPVEGTLNRVGQLCSSPKSWRRWSDLHTLRKLIKYFVSCAYKMDQMWVMARWLHYYSSLFISFLILGTYNAAHPGTGACMYV